MLFVPEVIRNYGAFPYLLKTKVYQAVNILTRTFIPSCAALIAPTYPPGPEPMTTRSAE